MDLSRLCPCKSSQIDCFLYTNLILYRKKRSKGEPMGFQATSNNFFSTTAQPSKVVAAITLIVAVAAAILAILSAYLHWGTASVISLSVLAGMSGLITFVILCCKIS